MHPSPNPQSPSLKESVLEKIHTGGLSMRPRLYFTAIVVATALVSVLALAISIFLFNFILFGIEASGRALLLGFGSRGALTFFMVFPWGLFALDVLLVVLLGWLIRKFKFGYQIPLLFVFVGLLALTVLFGFFIKAGTNLNAILADQDDRGALPLPFTGLYREAQRMPPMDTGFSRSVVTEIAGNIVTVIRTEDGTTTMVKIVVPSNEKQATTSGLRVGDMIFFVGERDAHMLFHAYGVRKVPHTASSTR